MAPDWSKSDSLAPKELIMQEGTPPFGFASSRRLIVKPGRRLVSHSGKGRKKSTPLRSTPTPPLSTSRRVEPWVLGLW